MLTVRCDYETPYLKKENDHWSCWREAQGDGEMEQDLESRLGQTYIQVGEDGVGLETPHSFSLLRQTMVVD